MITIDEQTGRALAHYMYEELEKIAKSQSQYKQVRLPFKENVDTLGDQAIRLKKMIDKRGAPPLDVSRYIPFSRHWFRNTSGAEGNLRKLKKKLSLEKSKANRLIASSSPAMREQGLKQLNKIQSIESQLASTKSPSTKIPTTPSTKVPPAPTKGGSPKPSTDATGAAPKKPKLDSVKKKTLSGFQSANKTFNRLANITGKGVIGTGAGYGLYKLYESQQPSVYSGY